MKCQVTSLYQTAIRLCVLKLRVSYIKILSLTPIKSSVEALWASLFRINFVLKPCWQNKPQAIKKVAFIVFKFRRKVKIRLRASSASPSWKVWSQEGRKAVTGVRLSIPAAEWPWGSSPSKSTWPKPLPSSSGQTVAACHFYFFLNVISSLTHTGKSYWVRLSNLKIILKC